MTLKKIVLAGVAVLSLAVPAAALAQPYDGRGDGWHEGWRGDDWRRQDWRAHEWRDHAYGGYGYGYNYGYGWGPRCVVEHRGFYNAWGRYEPQDVRVCR